MLVCVLTLSASQMLSCILLCADLCNVKQETVGKFRDNALLSQNTLTSSKNFEGQCFPLGEGAQKWSYCVLPWGDRTCCRQRCLRGLTVEFAFFASLSPTSKRQ